MKYAKFNRFQRKEIQQQKLKNALAGKGKFLYRNKSKLATLTLPRPTESGLRMIGPSKEFYGDDYYMQMVRSGDLILVEVLDDGNPKPAPALVHVEQTQEVLVESVTTVKQPAKKAKPKSEDKKMFEQKLLLDQPDRVTNKGKTEHVVDKSTGNIPLHEGDKQPQENVLLNESPSDDGFVVLK